MIAKYRVHPHAMDRFKKRFKSLDFNRELDLATQFGEKRGLSYYLLSPNGVVFCCLGQAIKTVIPINYLPETIRPD